MSVAANPEERPQPSARQRLVNFLQGKFAFVSQDDSSAELIKKARAFGPTAKAWILSSQRCRLLKWPSDPKNIALSHERVSKPRAVNLNQSRRRMWKMDRIWRQLEPGLLNVQVGPSCSKNRPIRLPRDLRDERIAFRVGHANLTSHKFVVAEVCDAHKKFVPITDGRRINSDRQKAARPSPATECKGAPVKPAKTEGYCGVIRRQQFPEVAPRLNPSGVARCSGDRIDHGPDDRAS